MQFAIATSRWSRRQYVPELEIKTLKYKPVAGAIDQYSALVKAYEERDINARGVFIDPEDRELSPVALEALAACGARRRRP